MNRYNKIEDLSDLNNKTEGDTTTIKEISNDPAKQTEFAERPSQLAIDGSSLGEVPLLKKRSSFIKEEKIKGSMELYWDNLLITARSKITKKVNGADVSMMEEKPILNSIKGIIRAGTFTAILGPSGSGKTSLLNFLAGRIVSNNLTITGTLKLNGVEINDVGNFSERIAYVQQEDILMASMTPRESFHFIANLRLKESKAIIESKIIKLLNDLGLEKCADTKIGNSLMKGISGGERKRTSIGVELLSNPSLIFLDEPTTGLDSSTAFMVMNLLKELSKTGRTVVSVIHQPSTEIFNQFDRLLLICKGNIFFQGPSRESIKYFDSIGYNCPKLSNPADYFMKIMNPESILIEMYEKKEDMNNTLQLAGLNKTDFITEKFNERVKFFSDSFKSHQIYNEMIPVLDIPVPEDTGLNLTSWGNQFRILFKRNVYEQIRNPFQIRVKIFQHIVFAVLLLILYNDLGTGSKRYQNTNGVLFFLTAMNVFGGVFGVLPVFNAERPIFLRERLNKSYTVSAYFWSKVLSELPVQLILPTINLSLVYFVVGLNNVYDWKFLVSLLVANITFQSAVSIGYFFSIIFEKLEVALSTTPLVLVPMMLFSGFLVTQDRIPYYFYPFEYLSLFKYGFQAYCLNQYQDLPPFECDDNVPCDPLKILDFKQDLWSSIGAQIAIGFGFRIFSYFGLAKISNSKRTRLQR